MIHNPQQIVEEILSEQKLNIFDIFAILFVYCDSRFRAILDESEGEYGRIQKIAVQLAEIIRARHMSALDCLGTETRKWLVSELESTLKKYSFDQKCYILARAIDIAYTEFVISHVELSRMFSMISPHLNLNLNLGLVYLKPGAPLVPRGGVIPVPYRTGTEKETNIRDHLDNFLCLQVPEGYEVDFKSLDFSTWLDFPQSLETFKIALVPLIDRTSQLVPFVSEPDEKGNRPYRVVGLQDVEGVTHLALEALKVANDEGATIVIFPELCVSEEVRVTIANRLRSKEFPSIKMVVAGSFHEKLGERWYNIAHVLDSEGNELWQQRKLEPNTIMHYELAQVPNLVVYAGSNLKEGIAASPRKIIIRDTPIGRMVVVICSDLLLEDSPHRKIFKDMRANLIIVPAMTSVVEPDFIDAAEEFAEHCQAVTIVCNACCLPRESLSSKKDDIKVSVAYYPRPPSKWWRRCNNVPGECTSHRCLREFILSLDAHPLGFE